MGKHVARLIACLAASGMVVGGGAAWGQDPPRKRVVVLKFSGTQAQRVRAAVMSGIAREADLVDEDEFTRAFEAASGPTRPDRLAAACTSVGADAIVEGAMRRSRRAWGAEVFVRTCANGEKVSGGRTSYGMRNLGGIGAIRGSIWNRLGDAIAESSGAGSSGGAAVRVATGRRAPPRADPAPPRAGAAPRSQARRAAADSCLFTEDEPPEGFPSHGDWVRRRNNFMVSCERERTRVAAAERRAREQAALQARQEAERRAREEEARRVQAARRAREEEARRVREEEARRAEADRRAREAEDRRRREEQDRRDAIARAEREERRRAEDEARRAQEERYAEERRRERGLTEQGDRRQREDELERRVAAYRDRLRAERIARADTGGVSTRSDVEPRDYDYEPEPDREPEDRYRGDRYDEDPRRDEEPYDPEREDDERWRRRDRDRRRGRGQEPSDEPGLDPAVAARRRRPVVFNIGAGVAIMNRSMSVEVTGADKPRTYSAPGYPELTVNAEFFPVALASPTSGAAGLGVFGTFRRHIFLETSGPTALGEQIKVATGEQELLFGALFRRPVGSSSRSPTISISAGYGYFSFELDPAAMSLLKPEVQMPTMIYRNLVLSAGLSIALTGSMGLEFGGSYRYVLDVGQAARDLFGADTKGGNGFAARAALHGEANFIAEGLTWSISGDYTVFSTSFSGTTAGDGGLVDGFPSGTDRYIRGLFLAAYRFR